VISTGGDSFRLETDKQYYSPGEILNGIVHVELERGVKIRHLDVKLQGREKVTIDPPVAMAPVAHKAHYSSTNEMLNLALRFLDNAVLAPGEMKIPFQFQLPPNALPSFIGRYADVTWKLSATMDIPWRSDLSETVYLRIWTSTSEPPALVELENPERSPKLNLKLTTNIYQPGENVRGQLTLLETGNLRSVRVELVQTEDSTALGVFTSAHRTANRTIQGFQLMREQFTVGPPLEFHLTVPADSTSSYKGEYSMVYWNVLTTLDIPYSNDVQLCEPIIVALRKAPIALAPTVSSKEKIPLTAGTAGESHVDTTLRPMTAVEPAETINTTSSPLPDPATQTSDIGSLILKLLSDGGSKDLLEISSELQQSSTGFVDLNTVMKICEALVSHGKVKRTGVGEFFAEYSLAKEPSAP